MGEWAEESAAEFDAIEPAVDWVKNHRLVPLVLLAEDASAPASIIGLAKNAP